MSIHGILNKQLPFSNLGLKGETPNLRPGAKKTSALHFQSSINNNPEVGNQSDYPNIAPSSLDLDGATPDKYVDNQPQ